MGGMHDIGGLQGFGAVEVDQDDTLFHERWERQVCGMGMAALMVPGFTKDAEMRHAMERLPAEEYVAQSYWERWTSALATLIVEKGLATPGELAELAGGEFVLGRPLVCDPLVGGSVNGLLGPGTKVRVREWHPQGHTRCPRYAQGRRGMIIGTSGRFPLPDRTASGDAADSTEDVYSVRFQSTELWGEGGRPGEVVHLDLWQTYLEVVS